MPDSHAKVVGAPVVDHLLDGVTLVNVVAQNGGGQAGKLGIASEAQADELLRAEVVLHEVGAYRLFGAS